MAWGRRYGSHVTPKATAKVVQRFWSGHRSANKFHARITEYEGVKYASKAEATRAYQLDLAKLGGEVIEWWRQITFTLGCPENKWRLDFVVMEPSGFHVEDVKGFETPAFRKNKKLWAVYGPCPLHIIKKHGSGWDMEFVEGGQPGPVPVPQEDLDRIADLYRRMGRPGVIDERA